MKGSDGSVILCDIFSWHGLIAVIPSEGKVNANRYLMVVSDHFHSMLKHFFPAGMGVFEYDNAPIHRGCVVAKWFNEQD